MEHVPAISVVVPVYRVEPEFLNTLYQGTVSNGFLILKVLKLQQNGFAII